MGDRLPGSKVYDERQGVLGRQGSGRELASIPVPVGIGEVQMTTFFYRTKALLKMSYRILLKKIGWEFNRR